MTKELTTSLPGARNYKELPGQGTIKESLFRKLPRKVTYNIVCSFNFCHCMKRSYSFHFHVSIKAITPEPDSKVIS